MSPRASIVVVEWNTARVLPACLDSLSRVVALPAEYEVVVVDNGSPTPIDHLRARYPRFRFVDTKENLGFAGGCQAALPHCAADVLVSLNPDAVVEPTWLHGMLRPFEDPSVGVVGCKVFYPGTRILQHAGGVLFDNGLSEHHGRGEVDVGQWEEVRDVTYVTGAAIAVRRAVVEQLGFFSTAYHPAYYEETELCIRARAAGWRVVFTPEAAITHHESYASGGVGPEFLARYHASRVRFLLRNTSVRDFVGRVLPAELAFLRSRGRSPERTLCLRAWVRGALSARLTERQPTERW